MQPAVGDAVVIMDGDLQDPPEILPQLIAKLDEGYDVVHGWRKNRKDTFINRRLPSMIANWIISKATGFPIHDLGCTAGITLNPKTPVEAIAKVAPLCEMVLVMTVNPGFGGQAFIPNSLDKIKDLRKLIGQLILFDAGDHKRNRFAGGPLGGQISFWKPIVSFTAYKRAFRKTYLGFNAQVGMVREWRYPSSQRPGIMDDDRF